MRYKIYAIALLAILLINIFRYELPYVEYAIFKNYIAKNLCVNKDKPRSCCEGKCFREKQLKQVQLTEDDPTSNHKKSRTSLQIKETKEFLQSQTLLPQAAEVSFHPPFHPETIIESRSVSFVFIPPQI